MFSPPSRRCSPPAWARSGHLQTTLGAWLSSRVAAPSERSGWRAVGLPLSDGGALAAWARAGARDPVIVFWHGLGGSTAAPYMRRAAELGARRGHPVLAVNHRGSGGARERTERPYMTGNTQDLADALLWVRARHPGRPVMMVGFSLSGNTLLKWLGERGRHLPDCALAVNPAIDLARTSRDLLAWPQHAYDLWILRSCRRWVPRLRGADPSARFRVPALSSLREFDRRYIAPVWGFPDVDSYYSSASSAPLLKDIERPTAILTAADDPIASAEVLRATPRSPAVSLHVEPRGGHLGYLSGGRGVLGLERWLDHALEHYLDCAEAGLGRAAPSPAEPLQCAR